MEVLILWNIYLHRDIYIYLLIDINIYLPRDVKIYRDIKIIS